MSVPAAAGTPQRADEGMIPSLFADEFNVEYYDETLLPKITTGKFYEGLLKKGDEVTIATLPDVEWHDHVKNAPSTPDVPESTPIKLYVNRAKEFNVLVDAVDAKQSHLQLGSSFSKRAVDSFDGIVQRQFFASIYNQAHASNQGATAGAEGGSYNLGTAASPLSVTKETATEFVTKFPSVLGEQNAYMPGKMWLCIPWALRFLFINSDLKNASLTGDGKSTLRTGRLGEIDGVTIYARNTLYSPSSGTWYPVGGNMDAISYINQLNSVRAIDSERFVGGKLYQGLNVYDWGVKKSEGLVVACVTKG